MQLLVSRQMMELLAGEVSPFCPSMCPCPCTPRDAHCNHPIPCYRVPVTCTGILPEKNYNRNIDAPDAGLVYDIENTNNTPRENVSDTPKVFKRHLSKTRDLSSFSELNSSIDMETDDEYLVKFEAETNLPTDLGLYRCRAYTVTKCSSSSKQLIMEPIVMIYGDVSKMDPVPVRVHDQCFTSEVFGSLKCDCRDQLQFAKRYIKKYGGVIIYLQQEGRGIGLTKKIEAYSLQEKFGLDTVEANEALGLDAELRVYHMVKPILDDIKVSSVGLITNNPFKIRSLEALGIHVESNIPIITESNEFNAEYLRTKANRMEHMLPMSGITK